MTRVGVRVGIAAVAAFGWLTAGSRAAGAQSNLREVMARALQENPDVRLARLGVDAAAAERRIARAVPNPILSAIPNAPYQYNASVPLDIGPDRLFRTRAAGQGARAARLDLDNVERQIRYVVRQGFYDLLLADALLRTAADKRNTFRQLLEADSVRVRVGDAPARNLVKSELELARSEADLTRAEADVKAARIAIQLLMGVPSPDTGFTIRGDLSYRDLGPLDAPTMPADRPDVAAAQARVGQARSARSLIAAELLPTPTMTLTYQPDGGFSTREIWTLGSSGRFSLGVELQLPLLNWNGGQRARAAIQVESAITQEQRARVQVEAEVVLARDQYRATSTLASRYQSGLLARARTALDQARYAYQAGATSLLDVLEAIRTYGDTQVSAAQACHDYWVSVAALSAAIGTDVRYDDD